MGDMLKTLTRRSFAANRLRSLITALAIALVAMLFTSVTTIAMGSAESVKRIMQIQKMSISDGDFRYMDKEQFEAMRQSDLIEKAGLRMPVGYLTNTLRHNVEFNVQDEIQSELTFCMPTGGRVPKRRMRSSSQIKRCRSWEQSRETVQRSPLRLLPMERNIPFP